MFTRHHPLPTPPGVGCHVSTACGNATPGSLSSWFRAIWRIGMIGRTTMKETRKGIIIRWWFVAVTWSRMCVAFFSFLADSRCLPLGGTSLQLKQVDIRIFAAKPPLGPARWIRCRSVPHLADPYGGRSWRGRRRLDPDVYARLLSSRS
jgi:hypothetical protein